MHTGTIAEMDKPSAIKDQIFLLIDLVIDNSFFRFGNKVFKQKIRIPMGVDPVQQMANLYSYHHEVAFMETLTKQDYSKAKKFNNTSCFIDDLGMLNNDGILVKEKEQIYPVELVLNAENQDDNHATYLDVEVNVERNHFKKKHMIKEKITSLILLTIQIYQDVQQSRRFQRESKTAYQQTQWKRIHHQSPEKPDEDMPWEA